VEGREGVLVAEVLEASEAERAGLRPGDLLLTLDRVPIRSQQDFLNAEGRALVGEELSVEYLRDGRRGSVSFEIEADPELDGADIDRRLAGARFTEVPTRLRNRGLGGVLLSELRRDSRLAYEGLRPGDVIVSVNRQRVDQLGEFRERVRRARGPLLLQLRRNGEAYIARID
jgi:S1-C subfamily serine protease